MNRSQKLVIGFGLLFLPAMSCDTLDEDCYIEECFEDLCTTQFVAAGTPVPNQIAGDCSLRVCDGMGKIVATTHDADRPADDGNVCTDEVCIAGSPVYQVHADGMACSASYACGPANSCQAGNCVGPNSTSCGSAELCFSGACFSPHCQGTVGLPNPPIRKLGPYPGDLKPVDLNGDGKDDLAVTDTVNNVVSVVLGNGNGTFGAQTDYPVGLNPVSIEAADLNGDGFADIVVANKGSNTVSVLFGNGNGTLASKVDYATGVGPTYVRLADLNGDGKAEIITPNTPLYATTIMFNDGNGGFAQKVDNTALGGGPSAVTAIDMNNDGSLDIVAVYQGSAVRVSYNNGSGNFTTASILSLYPYSTTQLHRIDAADLDNDGRVDVVVSDWDLAYILWNQGNGLYSVDAIGNGGSPGIVDVDIIDLNQDGRKDLVLGDSLRAAGIRINQGGRSFTRVFNGVSYVQGKVANLDGNGPRGLVALVSPLVPQTSNHSEFFAAWVDLTNPSWASEAINIDRFKDLAVGDMNGDGLVDLVSISMVSGKLAVARNNNGNGYVVMPYLNPGNSSRCLALADVNSDGTLDAVVGGIGTVVLTNPGNGALDPANSIAVSSQAVDDIVAQDFNQDGKPDIAFVNAGTNLAYVHMNLGGGVFAAAVTYPTGSQPLEINAADLDQDGDLDLVVSNHGNSPATATILLNNGSGSFVTGGAYTFGINIQSTTVGDLNGDGSIDIAASEAPIAKHSLALLFNNGNGTYAPPSTLQTADYIMSLQAVDIDGDGLLDLILGSFPPDTLVVHFNQGNGIFGSRVDYVSADGASVLVAADLNGDTKPDFVTYSNSGVASFRNTCLQ